MTDSFNSLPEEINAKWAAAGRRRARWKQRRDLALVATILVATLCFCLWEIWR